MRGTIIYDGLDLSMFGVYYDGSKEYDRPVKESERVSIPGRNGDLFIPKKRWANLPISFNCYIRDEFQSNYALLSEFLNSRKGYKVLETSGQPEIYRMAAFVSSISPDMEQFNKAGKFSIEFDCKPQRFLKSGTVMQEIASGTSITNPTAFASQPLIRIYGNGTLTIGTQTVTVTGNTNAYVDVDSEVMDCFYGTTNLNSKVALSGHEFPVLEPGANAISFTGITKVEITPRWYMI